MNKTEHWERHVDRLRGETLMEVGDPMQLFVIHNMKTWDKAEDPKWWTYQSNVHGVIVANVELTEEQAASYPKKRSDNVIEMFVRLVRVTTADFDESEHQDLLNCRSSAKGPLLQAVKEGLTLAQSGYDATRRQDKTYLGFATGTVRAALQKCPGFEENDNTRAGLLHQSSTLQTPWRYTTQPKLPSLLRERHDPHRKWESVDQWITRMDGSGYVQGTGPGCLGDDASTTAA